MTPRDALMLGVKVLDEVLCPAEFVFEFRGEGRSSGGNFAWGEYVLDNRRFELHFRRSLGLVTYHVSDDSASHEAYMRGLGVWERRGYPRFSAEPLVAFADLAADLGHAHDFLYGDASVLRRVAAEERVKDAERQADLMVGYVGDTRTLEDMRSSFRARCYGEVVSAFGRIKHPQRLSPADIKMVDIARRKVGG